MPKRPLHFLVFEDGEPEVLSDLTRLTSELGVLYRPSVVGPYPGFDDSFSDWQLATTPTFDLCTEVGRYLDADDRSHRLDDAHFSATRTDLAVVDLALNRSENDDPADGRLNGISVLRRARRVNKLSAMGVLSGNQQDLANPSDLHRLPVIDQLREDPRFAFFDKNRGDVFNAWARLLLAVRLNGWFLDAKTALALHSRLLGPTRSPRVIEIRADSRQQAERFRYLLAVYVSWAWSGFRTEVVDQIWSRDPPRVHVWRFGPGDGRRVVLSVRASSDRGVLRVDVSPRTWFRNHRGDYEGALTRHFAVQRPLGLSALTVDVTDADAAWNAMAEAATAEASYGAGVLHPTDPSIRALTDEQVAPTPLHLGPASPDLVLIDREGGAPDLLWHSADGGMVSLRDGSNARRAEGLRNLAAANWATLRILFKENNWLKDGAPLGPRASNRILMLRKAIESATEFELTVLSRRAHPNAYAVCFDRDMVERFARAARELRPDTAPKILSQLDGLAKIPSVRQWRDLTTRACDGDRQPLRGWLEGLIEGPPDATTLVGLTFQCSPGFKELCFELLRWSKGLAPLQPR